MRDGPTTRAPWWAPWAVIMVIIGGWVASTTYLAVQDYRASQTRLEIRELNIASCERVNLLREEVNAHVAILDAFLGTAAEARQEAGDSEVAAQYRILSQRLRPVPLPDCDEVFPEESYASESL